MFYTWYYKLPTGYNKEWKLGRECDTIEEAEKERFEWVNTCDKFNRYTETKIVKTTVEELELQKI